MTEERADEIERFVFYRHLHNIETFLISGSVFNVALELGEMKLTLRQELAKEVEVKNEKNR